MELDDSLVVFFSFFSFFSFFDFEPLMSSEDPVEDEPVVPVAVSLPVDPLIPEDEPLVPVPVPLPERESEPVEPPLMLPDPVLPVPVVLLLESELLEPVPDDDGELVELLPDDDGELVEPLPEEDGELVELLSDDDGELEPLPEEDGEVVELLPEDDLSELLELLPDDDLSELEPVAPADMMSSFWTLSASPEPEKLARTWSPSLRSSREARLPSFMTCVLESSFSDFWLPDSVSVLLERSKLWTRPWSALKWPLASAPPVEAVALEPDDLSLLDAVDPLVSLLLGLLGVVLLEPVAL